MCFVDWVCRSLVEILGRDGTLSLGQLIDRSGFARQTVYKHLNHLITAGESLRRLWGVVVVGQPSSTSSLNIWSEGRSGRRLWAFQRLRYVCRFEKGGWCKET